MKPTAAALDALLPQTQCRRCGYADCAAYAQAIAAGQSAINRCPPGGAEGIARLAQLTGQPVQPLDPDCGAEGPRRLAVIDEAWCIGCTLCIQACPVDCIVGAPRRMHTVIDAQCTGCELCVPACPVDCITMQPVSLQATGWDAWSAVQADAARTRHLARRARLDRDEQEHAARLAAHGARRHTEAGARPATSDDAARKRTGVEAALARARAQRADNPPR